MVQSSLGHSHLKQLILQRHRSRNQLLLFTWSHLRVRTLTVTKAYTKLKQLSTLSIERSKEQIDSTLNFREPLHNLPHFHKTFSPITKQPQAVLTSGKSSRNLCHWQEILSIRSATPTTIQPPLFPSLCITQIRFNTLSISKVKTKWFSNREPLSLIILEIITRKLSNSSSSSNNPLLLLDQ